MYSIKKKPEDFIVKELPSIEPKSEGSFTYFWLRKNDMTTSDAIHKVARAAKVKPRDVGFAGTKDKKAVTEQLISLKGNSDFSMKTKGLEITFYGKGKEAIRLGMLQGNRFEIRIMEISKKPQHILKFVNLYGEQRFGTKNAEIGKWIVKKDFKKAVELMKDSQGGWEKQAARHLQENRNDYVGAIRTIPMEIGMMFVHSYQSLIWNRCAEKISRFTDENLPIPIVGFETDVEDFKYQEILKKIMKEEGIKPRDFIIRQIPGFSYPGGMRMLYAKVHDLKIGALKDRSCKVSFKLDKGCYATVAVKSMVSPEDLR